MDEGFTIEKRPKQYLSRQFLPKGTIVNGCPCAQAKHERGHTLVGALHHVPAFSGSSRGSAVIACDPE